MGITEIQGLLLMLVFFPYLGGLMMSYIFEMIDEYREQRCKN